MARLTRQHFEERAAAIRTIEDGDIRLDQAKQAADYFASTNPAFNRQRFMTACGVDTYA
jgi:hypothetical protein